VRDNEACVRHDLFAVPKVRSAVTAAVSNSVAGCCLVYYDVNTNDA